MGIGIIARDQHLPVIAADPAFSPCAICSRRGRADGVRSYTRLQGPGQYAGLYSRFGRLIGERRSDVYVSPLRHAADAFLRGRRVVTAAFGG